jgi:lipopolysaccharide export system protein LptA
MELDSTPQQIELRRRSAILQDEAEIVAARARREIISEMQRMTDAVASTTSSLSVEEVLKQRLETLGAQARVAQLDGQKAQVQAQADQAQLQLDQQDLQLKGAALQQKAQEAAARQAAEDRRTQAEIASRQQMNNEDNQTALEIANLEVVSGENIAVSTGTGINP